MILWLCAHSCVMLCALFFPRHLIRLGAEPCLFEESLTERSKYAQGLETSLTVSLPNPLHPLCLSLSTYTYVRVLHPTHSSASPFLRPRFSKSWAATWGSSPKHTALQAASPHQSEFICWGWSWHSPADRSAGFPPPLCCLSVTHVWGDQDFPWRK